MADNKISMPGVFGGLMRYSDEYKSTFMLKPVHIIAFIIGFIILVLSLKFFFPLGS